MRVDSESFSAGRVRARTLLENLARSPTEEKYSRIRTTNPRIAAAIVVRRP